MKPLAKQVCGLALLALFAVPSAFAQTLCPGLPIEPGLGAAVPVDAVVGVNGDLVAIPLSEPAGAGSSGGAAVYRVLPGTSEVEHVDTLLIPGLGQDTNAEILGCAIASSGAVLVARTQPGFAPVELTQLRRSTPGASVATTTTTTIGEVEAGWMYNMFSCDQDRAVIGSTLRTPLGDYIVYLEFFAVDASGNWYLEDLVRTVEVWYGASVFGVHVHGEQALVQTYVGCWAGERTLQYGWSTPVILPGDLRFTSSPGAVALSEDRLIKSSTFSASPWISYETRRPGLPWLSEGSIDTSWPTGASSYPTDAHFRGELFSVQTHPQSSYTLARSRLVRLPAAGGFMIEGTVEGAIVGLSDEFVVVDLGAGHFRVMAVSEILGDVRACAALGAPACEGQRAGDLHYLVDAPISTASQGEVSLSDAPVGQLALLLGSDQLVPSAGMLSSLCLGQAGEQLRHPTIRRVDADGTAVWPIDPLALPLATGGTSNGLGRDIAFQAVVRTPVGTATTRAVVIDL